MFFDIIAGDSRTGYGWVITHAPVAWQNHATGAETRTIFSSMYTDIRVHTLHQEFQSDSPCWQDGKGLGTSAQVPAFNFEYVLGVCHATTP